MRKTIRHIADGPATAEQRVVARLRRRAEDLFGSRAAGDRAVLAVLASHARPCDEDDLVAALEDLAFRHSKAH